MLQGVTISPQCCLSIQRIADQPIWHEQHCCCALRYLSWHKVGTNTPVSTYLRRNPIEDGAISGFSGQKSIPE